MVSRGHGGVSPSTTHHASHRGFLWGWLWGGENQDFLFWGQGLWGKEPGTGRAAGSGPLAWRLLLALLVKPAGPVGHAPFPASSGMQGILRKPCCATQAAAGRDHKTQQLPGQGEEGEEDVRSCSSSILASRDAAKWGRGLPERCMAPAVPACRSGALHSHKPAFTPTICFLKKMRFV